jgi:hypothetical protein
MNFALSYTQLITNAKLNFSLNKLFNNFALVKLAVLLLVNGYKKVETILIFLNIEDFSIFLKKKNFRNN